MSIPETTHPLCPSPRHKEKEKKRKGKATPSISSAVLTNVALRASDASFCHIQYRINSDHVMKNSNKSVDMIEVDGHITDTVERYI